MLQNTKLLFPVLGIHMNGLVLLWNTLGDVAVLLAHCADLIMSLFIDTTFSRKYFRRSRPKNGGLHSKESQEYAMQSSTPSLNMCCAQKIYC